VRVRSVNLCVFVYWKGSEGGRVWESGRGGEGGIRVCG